MLRYHVVIEQEVGPWFVKWKAVQQNGVPCYPDLPYGLVQPEKLDPVHVVLVEVVEEVEETDIVLTAVPAAVELHCLLQASVVAAAGY